MSVEPSIASAGNPALNPSQNRALQKKPDHYGEKTYLSNILIQPQLAVGSPGNSYEREADAVADRVMNMPEPSFVQRKCSECEKEELQRKPLVQAFSPFVQTKAENTVSDGLSDSIHSSRGRGSVLDADTNTFMSSRFGHDFSEVNIHIDSRSAQLNQSLNAKAFTVGNDIYFNQGQYRPGSSEGKHLLAHELTHVVQQTGKVSPKLIQRACYEEENPNRTLSSCPEGATDIGRQPQDQRNTLDAKANAIIATASGSGSNSSKALRVVNDMICTYMPGKASRVRKISYFGPEQGLGVQSVGSGTSTRGDICVGDTFLEGTTRVGISRRVLQLAHEMDHIEQYRTGLAGRNNRPEREFLAFYNEGLADEFIGTGRMSHGTRRRLIDAALGWYNCFSDALKTTHRSKQQELLTRRQTVNGTRGNESTNPPSSCVRS